MRHHPATLLLTVFALVQWAIPGTTGKIAGRVVDASTGEPLAGVNILIEGTSSGAATSEDGSYFILRVPPGVYVVRASMIGYSDVRVRNVRVRLDLTSRVDFELTPEVLGLEEVTITAERPLVRPDVTYSQSNVDAEEISALPVEEFEQVLALQAGVVVGSEGAMHIRGGRGGEIAYLIDGVSVTDPFSYGMAVEIENNAIQELQLISGTFNAEYGQAMSGVVNIVTKDGRYDRYDGSVEMSMGDYWSGDTSLFTNVDDLRLQDLTDVQTSLSGPVPLLGRIASFSLSGRFFNDLGHLYGVRRYLPDSHVQDPATTEWDLVKPGDSLYVPMNWERQHSGQGKVSLKLGGRSTFSVNFLGSDTRYKTYTHRFRFNPDGDYRRFRTNRSVIAKIEQVLSPSTYFILSYSDALNRYKYYVFDDPTDTTRYDVDPRVFNAGTPYDFYVGGFRMGHYNRTTRIHTFKLDLLSQVTKLHQVKIGAEFRKSRLHQKSFTILYDEDTDYLPQVPKSTSPNFDEYVRHPYEYSGYVQDKVEYKDIVVNMGLRWDFFEPDWKVPVDPADPNVLQPLKPINQYFDEDGDGEISESEMREDNEKTEEDRLEQWFRTADPASQLSPRLALAFPITDRGVMHFSYGHFFQVPPYAYLYTNPDFEVTPGLSTTMGNAELDPQRTTQYEVGFQQQIGLEVGVDVTGFYKDIRDLVGTRIVDTFIAGDRYAVYVNRDYGNVRGVTFSLTKRGGAAGGGYLSGALDYTYSVAEGNASDPNASYYDELSGNEPEKQLVALDWDQRHTLNSTVTFHGASGWGVSFIAQYGSGLPYTPSLAGTRIAFENSERKPDQFNVDVRSFWNFRFLGLNASLHFNIYNLFDLRNEILVYSDTGRATYSLIPTYTPQDQTYNTLDEYLKRPDFYSRPRQLKVGIAIHL